MEYYKQPALDERSFHCPHCGVLAQQRWFSALTRPGQLIPGLKVVLCQHCGEYAVWREEEMIWPLGGAAPVPNADLPEEVKRDYNEAKAIGGLSPRGAAALLRLAIQRLCMHLGGKGKNLNEDIGGLVEKGLSTSIQEALDTVRVVGAHAVHPGEMNLDDDSATVRSLFDLINLIADRMISEPNRVRSLYDRLPKTAREAIDKRDKGKGT